MNSVVLAAKEGSPERLTFMWRWGCRGIGEGVEFSRQREQQVQMP